MPHRFIRLTDITQNRFGSALALVLALLATAFAYVPGLAGDFVFDDHVNLNALGRYGGVRDLQTLLFYLTSGIADPTGRPVALASFLLDARDWPADPLPFKRTNLLIHLANGLLLFNVLMALGLRLSQDVRRVRATALIAAALWLVNPLWASTVLYVVQRHAMLATLFVLAGIRTWVASRNAFDNGNIRRGWWLAILAVPVFGALAGLSKANGFLLPLLLAVLELTVLRKLPAITMTGRRATWVLVWLPTTLLLGGLCWYALQVGLEGTQGRSWTLGQRLLTQPRALCEYLWRLIVPSLGAIGVFSDGFVPSQNWRTPPTTLPAALVVIAMAGSVLVLRRKWPIVAAALGFFLAGHAMESSVIMLELYFEHRNYLPATLLFWPLAWWLTAPSKYRRWLLVGIIGYTSLMLLTTAVQSRLWGDPLELALVWAEQNPQSARAQTNAFLHEIAAGRYSAAERRLAMQLKRSPHEPQFALNLLDLRCDQRRVVPADIDHAAFSISASNGLAFDMTYQWLAAALLPDSEAACSSLQERHLQALLQAATTGADQPDPNSPEMRARAQRLAGHLALRQSNCTAALDAFDNRISIQPRPEFMQSQVVLLATECTSKHALTHLERYLDSGAPVSPASSPILRLRDRIMRPWWSAYWEDLSRTLHEDAKNGATAIYQNNQNDDS